MIVHFRASSPPIQKTTRLKNTKNTHKVRTVMSCKHLVKRKNSSVYHYRIIAPTDLKSVSERVIPIHLKLIELGFLNFVKEQKKKNSQRLFSHLKLDSDGYKKMWVDFLMSNGFLRLESRRARRVFTLWDIRLQMGWNKHNWMSRWLQSCLGIHFKALGCVSWGLLIPLLCSQSIQRITEWHPAPTLRRKIPNDAYWTMLLWKNQFWVWWSHPFSAHMSL